MTTATKILTGDVELRASERMTDDEDGGGEMSAVIISDNKVNQLFGPISESDRVVGRVNLRQVYTHIATPTADTYYGSNVIIDSPPDDTNVTPLLFSTEVSGASRSDAKAYIEKYITIGPKSRMQPLGTQVIGSEQIIAYQKLDAPLPGVGDVYVLSIEATDTLQAFKIKTLTSYTDTFAYVVGAGFAEFKCTVLIITLTQALEYTFPGLDPAPTFPGTTWIRKTLASDSAAYFGIKALTEPAAQGALSLQVNSTHAQLVPVSITSTPILDTALDTNTTSINAGSHTVDVSNYSYFAADTITIANRILNWTKTLRPIPAPGTLTIKYRAGGKWYILTDGGLVSDGTGSISGDSRTYGSGSISYVTGTASIVLGDTPDIGSAILWSWGTAALYQQSTSISINAPRMTLNLNEIFHPSQLITVSYTLNSQVVSLTSGDGATWTTDGNLAFFGDTHVTVFFLINPATLFLEWTTLPDPSTQIVVSYLSPDSKIEVLHNDAWVNSVGVLVPHPVLTHLPIVPGTLLITYSTVPPPHFDWINTIHVVERRNAIDHSSWDGDLATGGGFETDGTEMGTVDHTTGEIIINPGGTALLSYVVEFLLPGASVAGSEVVEVIYKFNMPLGILVCHYLQLGFGTTSKTQTFDLPPVEFKLGSAAASLNLLVPMSLRFKWGTQEYRDTIGNGTIYRHATPWGTATGVYAGTIDYQTKTVALTDYVPAAVSDVSVLSCLTQKSFVATVFCYGTTPGSPVAVGTFSLRCSTIDGRELTTQADASGAINEEEIQGTINQDIGTFELYFGKMVLDSSLSTAEKQEAWYDANNVIDGNIWRPTYILPSTIRMNCVVQTTIPIAAAELGLDPLRLPNTGRVPIFKTGYRAVVHNTAFVTLPNPAVAGSTINCGRTKIARVRLEDAQGRRVPDDRMFPGHYAAFSSLSSGDQANYLWWEIRDDGTVWVPSSMDLDQGLVELASPLNLTGYIQPLKLYHTIEDAVMITGTDVSGLINCNRALTHDYTANDSFLSSQLYIGDLHARYINLFSQSTWTKVWSDSMIGDATAGKYNDVLYPVLVTNDGVIEERWRLTFTSTTAFSVYGERSGLIAVGDINSDCNPMNPVTNNPYFSIDHRGWGSGWSIGNTVRFNTLYPGVFWAARCISPGVATGAADSIGIAFRGDSEPAT